MSASTWREREQNLSDAYESVARLHNAIGVTARLDPGVRPTFHDRPYRIPDAGRFVRALRDRIRDEGVRSLPLTGTVDQFIDSTDALGDRDLRRAATKTQLPRGLSETSPPPAAA